MANKNNTTYTPNDYKVEILESSKELSKRERIMFKDITNAVKLDTALAGDGDTLVIQPTGFVIPPIHNGQSKNNPDYQNYIIFDSEGNKYVTGSPSFWSAFKSIWDELGDDDSGWSIEVYKRESKNYAGKSFITCSVV